MLQEKRAVNDTPTAGQCDPEAFSVSGGQTTASRKVYQNPRKSLNLLALAPMLNFGSASDRTKDAEDGSILAIVCGIPGLDSLRSADP